MIENQGKFFNWSIGYLQQKNAKLDFLNLNKMVTNLYFYFH